MSIDFVIRREKRVTSLWMSNQNNLNFMKCVISKNCDRNIDLYIHIYLKRPKYSYGSKETPTDTRNWWKIRSAINLNDPICQFSANELRQRIASGQWTLKSFYQFFKPAWVFSAIFLLHRQHDRQWIQYLCNFGLNMNFGLFSLISAFVCIF